MTNKNSKKALRRINAKFMATVTSAVDMGFDMADGYSRAVVLFCNVKASANALAAASTQYVIGYVARSLSAQLGNMDRVQQYAEAEAIIAKAGPDTSKDDRRTHEQHKAVRAAQTSLASVKRAAGIKASKGGGRKPRQGSNDASPPPVDLVKAAPTFNGAYAKQHGFDTVRDAANDYFATAAAALLATVNKNAHNVTPAISSAVSDLHAALKAAGLIPSAE
jgi:hypothetical protein